MTEYVKMYAWLMRRVFKTKNFYVAWDRSKSPAGEHRLDEFDFWLTFYQLLAYDMEGENG